MLGAYNKKILQHGRVDPSDLLIITINEDVYKRQAKTVR